MQPIKPGIKTSEFWITAVANIVGAVIAILVARGLISGEEGELWIQLAGAVLVAVIPVALALINASYIKGRSELKRAELQQK